MPIPAQDAFASDDRLKTQQIAGKEDSIFVSGDGGNMPEFLSHEAGASTQASGSLAI